MRLVLLAALAALAPLPALAQSVSKQMLDSAAQMRANAEQLKASLSPEDYAEMIRGAEEIEKAVKEGAFGPADAAASAPGTSAATGAPATDVATRIADAHQGRLDWLARETVCVGFSWENADSFKMTTGDRLAERNARCSDLYRDYRTYFLTTRNGGDRATAQAALEAYDRKAQAAVAWYAGK